MLRLLIQRRIRFNRDPILTRWYTKKTSFGFVVMITTARNRNFARQDTYFLENWSCSGLRYRPGFIVAGALRSLLCALS